MMMTNFFRFIANILIGDYIGNIKRFSYAKIAIENGLKRNDKIIFKNEILNDVDNELLLTICTAIIDVCAQILNDKKSYFPRRIYIC